MRRQITPMIVNQVDVRGRRLIYWATIDGLRVIAARQGDYRPMENAPLLEIDEKRVDPDINPLGIIRAEVRAWKRSDEGWHPVAGEAWWDEYAPIRDVWAPDANGRRGVAGRTLEDAWRRMGRVMIAKCAEAQALRRGWPDVLSGLYSQEELQALHRRERTASEAIAEARRPKHNCDARVLWFVFERGGSLTPVKLVDAPGRLLEFIDEAKSADELLWFNGANAASLAVFWDWAPGRAFELKAHAEARAASFGAPCLESDLEDRNREEARP
jgi:phage recombination protein Bet